jgi:alpha-N-arabinofuranosidase
MEYRLTIDAARRIGTVNANVFGHFIEHLGRCIYGGVFEPGSALADERGFRTDVVAAMRKIGVPLLRWPGGNFASNYHWEDGIGPPASRPPRFDLAWRSVEPNLFGTEEFLAYCDVLSTAATPCRPYICLNTGTGTLDEAVRWLEYCNLDAEQAPSYHARWRKDLGRTTPYAVPYWGIGNEVFGAWQVGSTTAAAYAATCVQYARFLRAVDPTVRIVAVGADDPDWDLEVLRRTSGLIDYLSIHAYFGTDDYEGTVAGAVQLERRLRLLCSVLDVAAGMTKPSPAARRVEADRPVEIALDEWNIWYRGRSRPWEEFYGLKDALFAAGAFNAMYRLCPRVTMANLAQMVNALGMLHTTPEALVRSPTYHVFDLYANHTGRTVLDVALRAEDAAARAVFSADVSVRVPGRPVPAPKIVNDVPFVDVTATLDAAEERLSLAVVNRHRSEAATLRVTLAGLRALGLTVYELTGNDPLERNTVEHPDAVVPSQREGDATAGAIQVAPMSVTILEWSVGEAP